MSTKTFLTLLCGLFIGWFAHFAWMLLDRPSETGTVVVSKTELGEARDKIDALKSNAFRQPLVLEEASIVLSEGDDEENGVQDSLEQSKSIYWSLKQNGQYADAFNLLYDLLLESEEPAASDIRQFIASQVEEIELVMRQGRPLNELVDLYNHLVNLETDNLDYYVRLAHWHIKAENYQQAETLLPVLRNDLAYLEVADLLEAQIAADQAAIGSKQSGIPLVRKGRHFLVDVILDQRRHRLMIDTGASLTVIKQTRFESTYTANRYDTQEMMIQSASGQAPALRTRFAKLSLGEESVSNLDVVILPLSGFEFDGLLGMNVLGQFDFYIDQNTQTLFLK